MIYEQPLNEQIRLCLRLEYLFIQASYYLDKESTWDSHQMLKIILEILQTVDRPDLKNKICQTLNQYARNLVLLEKMADIDQQKLASTLKKIDLIIDSLHFSQKKIGQDLRENGFLATIGQRLYTPAGTCFFSLPAYHLWLQQKPILRQQQLKSWVANFAQLQEIVELILKLVRESTNFKIAYAQSGFYQGNLDPNISYQLVRINLKVDDNFFPEISVGRFRLAVHFFNMDITGQIAQATDDLSFDLACCHI